MRKHNSDQLLPALPSMNFSPGMKKTIIGSIVLYISEFVLSEIMLMNNESNDKFIKERITMVCAAFVSAGLLSVLDNSLIWYCKNLSTAHSSRIARQSANKKRRRKQKKVIATSVQIQFELANQASTYYRIKKYINMLFNIFYSISMTAILFNFSKFTLTSTTNIDALTLRQFISSTIVMFPIISVVAYNVRELFLNATSKYPRQSNSPFFGMLTAYCQNALLNLLQQQLDPIFMPNSIGNVEQQIAAMQLAIKLSYLMIWLQSAIHYQVYKHLFNLMINFTLTVLSRPTIELVETNEITQPDPKKRRKTRQQQSNKNKSVLFQSVEEEENPWVYLTTNMHSDNSQTNHRQKLKIKTKGTPGKKYLNQSPIKSTVEQLPTLSYRPDADERTNKLALIRELRHYKQIKERDIRKELGDLIRFLPNGRIKHSTGSEHHLIWQHQGKTYRLKYETPHGKGATNEYKGRKLHKILNVLETGYLWGWGHDNIQAYMAEHNSSRYLGTLTNILFRRPDFEEPSFPALSPK